MAKHLRILIYGVLVFYGSLLLGFHVYAAQKGQVILIGQYREYFFWLLFIAAWTIVGIVSLIRYKMKGNARHPKLAMVGVIAMTLFLLGGAFCDWFVHGEDNYHTFQSPDGEHAIVAYEHAVLISGTVRLYEKTGPFLAEYETILDVYDGDHPITRGAYQIEWVDDTVIFSVPAGSWQKEYGPNQWAPRWGTAKIELGVPGRNAYKYNRYRYADGSLHTEDEITYVPPDRGDRSDQTNTNVQKAEELFPGEKIITAGYRALFHELSDSSCEFDIRYGAKESDSTCIVLDNGTYIEYLIYNGRSQNDKCGIYVLYRCEKETDGSYSSENAEIVDMFAVVNDTEKIIRSGKTSWGATGSEEYLLATGE